MRKLYVYLSAALFTAMLPVLAHAQFQQPTPEELKMSSDPKAPGAAAVYLNIEEIADDNLHYESFYARIKVLAEKGKSLATVEVPYGGVFRVTDIKARTIHPDGTIVPLEGKPENLLTVKSGNTKIGKMVFTLPSVTVGSILEYQYQVRYPDGLFTSPRWELQRGYFVHQAHYAFAPFKGFMKGSQNMTSHYLVDERTGTVLNDLMWSANLPPGAPPVSSDANGRFSLTVTDIPARPEEAWMPPIESVLYKVQFYYKGAESAAEFWQAQGKAWAKDADRFAQPSSALRQAVAGIVAPSDSDLVKAQKLYAAVQALDNTDYSRAKSQSEMQQLKLKAARHAEDVWTQKGGDSREIALLYLAMLRAAGFKAYAATVADRRENLFDYTYMEMDQFDATLVIVDAGGKETFTDPGERMCPFGVLAWGHTDTMTIRESAKQLEFSTLPPAPYTQNTIYRPGDVNIDEHGAITGTFNFVLSGQEALHWRQLALQNDETEVKKQFDQSLEQIVPAGIDAHVDHFIGMDNSNIALMAIVKVKGSMGAAMSKRLLLPAFFFESRASEPFVAEANRVVAIDMHFPERVIDQVTYDLPPGVTVEGAPENATVPWQPHAVYVVKTTTAPGQITIERDLFRGFDLLKPNEYQDLRGFYQKVASGDQQELVLHAAPEVTGH